MKPYSSLYGFLKRFEVFRIGRLSCRIHKFLSADGTPFFHTHPYFYITIVLTGGYLERTKRGMHWLRAPCVRFHTPWFQHRIEAVLMNTKTLFISWRAGDWGLEKIDGLEPLNVYEDGVYMFTHGFMRHHDGIWFRAAKTIEAALAETRPSIHQVPEEQPVKVHDK